MVYEAFSFASYQDKVIMLKEDSEHYPALIYPIWQ